tara:strand:- start:217 stop:648 length:432 start_codon:yes stop_codon:yes gene_type:complete
MRNILYAAAMIVLAGCTDSIHREGLDSEGKFNGYYVGHFVAKDCPGLSGQSTRIDAYVDDGLLIGKADGILIELEVSTEGNFIGTALVDKDDLSNSWMFTHGYFRFQGVVGEEAIQAQAGFGTAGSKTTCPEDGLVTVELKKE